MSFNSKQFAAISVLALAALVSTVSSGPVENDLFGINYMRNHMKQLRFNKQIENFMQEKLFKDILEPAASMSHQIIGQQLPAATARHHLGLAIKDFGNKINFPLDGVVDKAEVIIYATLEKLINLANYGFLAYEKAYQPDVCLLKSVCSAGTNITFLRHMLGRISPNALEGSVFMRALTRGVMGVNCEESFICPNQPGSKGTLGPAATGSIEAIKN